MRFSLRALLLLVVGVGCSKEPATTTTASPTASPPATSPTPMTPPAVTPDPPKIAPKPMAQWKDGDVVTVRGKISTIMWQHMMRTVPGKKHGYFDVENEKTQIVVYWKEAPTCTHLIEVTGKVVELRGSSKKPGEQESKVDDSYSERHIDVESTRCVE